MASPKRRIITTLALTAFAGGMAHQIGAPRQPLSQVDIPFTVLAMFLTFLWYRYDALQRGYARSALLNTMVVALSVVALPYYFFRTRGFVGGLRATVIFALCVVAYSVLQYLGQYTAYYARAI